MAFRILGNEIISDQRNLIGVNTAGITSSLNVGNDISLDAQTGIATVGQFNFVGESTVYTGTTADLSGGEADKLAAASVIKTYVDAQVGGGILKFLDDDGTEGEVAIGAGSSLVFTGQANEIETLVGSATSEITFGLSTEMIAPGSLQVTGLSTFVQAAKFDATLQIADGPVINAISTSTALAPADNSTLVTAGAIKSYVDSSVGAANNLDFAGGTGTGQVDLSGGTFSIVGTSLEVETSASGETLTIGLTNDVAIGGSMTAGTFYGDGSNLDIALDNLSDVDLSVAANNGEILVYNGSNWVAGVSTATIEGGDVLLASLELTGDLTANGNIVGDTATNISGIASVTADNFYGDGSNLTGISTSASIAVSNDSTTATEFAVAFTDQAVGDTAGNQSIKSDAEGLSADAFTYRPSDGKLYSRQVDTLSDERYKENIEVIPAALEKVNALRGVTYDWKSSGKSAAGIVAQELLEVLPQAVDTTDADRYTVNYNSVIGLLVQAVNELTAEVESLKKAQ